METSSLEPYVYEIRALNKHQPANNDLKMVVFVVSLSKYKYSNTYNVPFSLLLKQSEDGQLFQIQPSPFSKGSPKVMTFNGLLSVDTEMVEKDMKSSWIMIITGYWRLLLTEQKEIVNNDCAKIIMEMMNIRYMEIDHEIQIKNFPRKLDRECATTLHHEWTNFKMLKFIASFQISYPDTELDLDEHPWTPFHSDQL